MTNILSKNIFNMFVVCAFLLPANIARMSLAQNPGDPIDVTGDTLVGPDDALVVLNRINGNDGGSVVMPSGDPPYIDTNVDGFLAPIDALLVFNAINQNGAMLPSEFETNDEGNVNIRLALTDSTGADVDSVAVGDEVDLSIFVDDTRADAGGVFYASVSLDFGQSGLAVQQGTVFADDLVSAQNVGVLENDTLTGLSAMGGLDPPGAGEQFFARVPLLAESAGSFSVSIDNDSAYALVYGLDTPVSVSSSSVDVAVVPEPSSATLMAIGFVLLIRRRRLTS